MLLEMFEKIVWVRSALKMGIKLGVLDNLSSNLIGAGLNLHRES